MVINVVFLFVEIIMQIFNIVQELEKLKQDKKFILFQEKIVNTKLKIIGVKIPDLRKLAKAIIKSNNEVIFNNESDKYFESVVLEGFLIAEEKDKQKLKHKLNLFYKKMDNWAVVDMICSSLSVIKKDCKQEDFDYFKSLTKSKDVFTARFGIVGLLKYFSEVKYNEIVLKTLEDIKCGDYYVDMAIAWLISEIIVKSHKFFF